MKIQITTSSFGKAGKKPIQLLNKKGLHFETNPYQRKLTEIEAVEVIDGADGVIAGTEPLTQNVLVQLPQLKVISRCGVGLDNVDLQAAREQGITVLNTPNVHVNAVAELALAGTLSAMRRVSLGDRRVRSGNWEKTMGTSLYEKKVGIIGFGKVGRQFAGLLSPFSVSISVYDPFITPSGDEYPEIQFTGLDELLSASDVISIHIPYSEKTRHLLDADTLGACKPDVTLVNTARGGIIDEDALYEFLQTHPSACGYLDVFEEEPYNGRLQKLENVQFTPHVGTTTRETREEMEYQAVANLVDALHSSGLLQE